MNGYAYSSKWDEATEENVHAILDESDGIGILGETLNSEDWEEGEQWVGLCATRFQWHIGHQTDNTDGTGEGCQTLEAHNREMEVNPA